MTHSQSTQANEAPLIFSNVDASWLGGFDGSGSVAAEQFSADVTLPKEFGGQGKNATPEDLILSAITSCYLITLGIVLEKSGCGEPTLTGSGTLQTKGGANAQIKRAIIRVSVATDSAVGKTISKEHFRRAKEYCLISKAIAGNVSLEVDAEVDGVSVRV